MTLQSVVNFIIRSNLDPYKLSNKDNTLEQN